MYPFFIRVVEGECDFFHSSYHDHQLKQSLYSESLYTLLQLSDYLVQYTVGCIFYPRIRDCVIQVRL